MYLQLLHVFHIVNGLLCPVYDIKKLVRVVLVTYVPRFSKTNVIYLLTKLYFLSLSVSWDLSFDTSRFTEGTVRVVICVFLGHKDILRRYGLTCRVLISGQISVFTYPVYLKRL